MPTDARMDAVVIQASGSPAQSLAFRSEPVPKPGPGEVHAAAVNPLDVANAAGYLSTPLPMIPGGDYAGVVVSDGDHAGQEVWGSGPALGMALAGKRPGTHARFVALPETWLSRKPDCLSMAQAAAVGRSYRVAWETVMNAMKLMPGETILITGGAGMGGQAATAIARWRGAEPIIADRRKPDGVENFIDTSSAGIREAVLEITGGRGADLVLDTVGGALFEPALRSLRFDGRMAGIFSSQEPVNITPAVKTWPLTDSAEAYQTVLDGSAGIKQVLLPTGRNQS